MRRLKAVHTITVFGEFQPSLYSQFEGINSENVKIIVLNRFRRLTRPFSSRESDFIVFIDASSMVPISIASNINRIVCTCMLSYRIVGVHYIDARIQF